MTEPSTAFEIAASIFRLKGRTSIKPICWICKLNVADSGEHDINKTDFIVQGIRPTPKRPIFHHQGDVVNRPIRSLNAEALKLKVKICRHCNTTRTQPFDRAWAKLSEWLHNKADLRPGRAVRGDRVFSMNARQGMLYVHLYFVKKFGIHLATEPVSDIPLDSFSRAIMAEKPHPHLYLRLTSSPFGQNDPKVVAGTTDIHTPRNPDGSLKFADWQYYVGKSFVMRVLYGQGQVKDNWWHPKQGTTRLLIESYHANTERKMEPS